jgi:hypothetical protein
MMYVPEMSSDSVIQLPSFIKIDSTIQKMWGDTQTAW